MVPCRRADDAAILLFLRQMMDLVQWPADLVRARTLKHLRLQPHFETRVLAQEPGHEYRRVPDVGFHARACSLELGEGYGGERGERWGHGLNDQLSVVS